MTNPKIDQIALLKAITKELERQNKNLALITDAEDFFKIAEAANLICDLFNKKGLENAN